MQTLLANVKRGQVQTEPFPHVVVADALPDDVCLRLISEYPSLKALTNDAESINNQRFSLSASQALSGAHISSLWREFVRLHTSELFFGQVINLFGDDIRLIYPSLEQSIGALDELNTGMRHLDSFSEADILLDAQICVNTRVIEAPSAVRRIHVDSPQKLFAGLYYLRHPDDTSTGGDLEICRFVGKPSGLRGAEIDDRSVEVVKTIKYQRNVLVMFINNIRALHGVTVRSVTPFPRYLFNLVGEVKNPLFDLEQYQESKRRSSLIKTLRGAGKLLKRRVAAKAGSSSY